MFKRYSYKHRNYIFRILLLFALIITMSLLVWLLSKGEEDVVEYKMDKEISESLKKHKSQKSATKLKLNGVSNNGKKYYITAKQATEQSSDTLTLLEVNAKFCLGNLEEVNISSKQGFIDLSAHSLTLNGAVILRHGESDSVETNSLKVHYLDNTAFGNNKVLAKNSWGETIADSFSFSKGDKGRGMLVMQGNVHSTINDF